MRSCSLFLLAALVLSLSFSARAAEPPPTAYVGGKVFTGTTDHVDASWFVVQDGKFVDAGAGALPARWSAARRVELGGRFVAPGFVDAHVHFLDGGLSLLQVDAGDARSMSEVEAQVARAARAPMGGWVVVRNVGVDALGGAAPTHARLRRLVDAASGAPLVLLLKGGHTAYASPAALEQLGIDRDSDEPRGGHVARDAQGEPTGLLVDAAAWDALRAIGSELEPDEIARAILAAQQLAVRYGVTALGDNTFFPVTGAMYQRLANDGVFRLRVSVRAFGAEPVTRLTMKSLGLGPWSRQGTQIRFFGDKWFLDASLSPGERSVAGEVDRGPRFTTQELRDDMLFSAPFGTAFHTQSREGAERLAAARLPIRKRRESSLPDVIDHCGQCGGGGLPARLRDAGLRVTLLPGQLHELPTLLAQFPAAEHAALLAFRELFAAGLEPALTSDWPYGAEVAYPALPDGFHRTGFSPLASVAVAVTGKRPDGSLLEGAESRTLSVGQALLGVTAYGANAIGRDDVGRIRAGAHADFVVLPVSPFEVDPLALYPLDVAATYIAGRPAYGALPGDQRDDVAKLDAASRFSSRPSGDALSPIVGYDPVTGLLLGGAWFFYPYQPKGLVGSLQLYGSPSQLRGRVESEVIAMGAFGRVSPRLWLTFDTLRDRYYGVGMDTDPDRYVTTKPLRLDTMLGVIVRVSRTLNLGASVRSGVLRDAHARQIYDAGAGREGHVNGGFVGARLELTHDTRDNAFATRFGGSETVWTESYGVQAGVASFRQRFGVSLRRFVPLLAPDFVLALRAEAAGSAGDSSYVTDYALGGGDWLRGYYFNRFRGQWFAAGSSELRWPIFGPISGTAFFDVGRVWLEQGSNAGRIGTSGGGGLRIGLPPDRLVRLRFDFGFAPDQWGLFFKFNEAF